MLFIIEIHSDTLNCRYKRQPDHVINTISVFIFNQMFLQDVDINSK